MVRRSFFLIAAMIVPVTGCGEAWMNQTASLGGGTAGNRGDIGVVVLNNTPYRAVMTLGSYDQASQSFSPDAEQFTLHGATQLDPDASGGFLSFQCGRVFSLGGSRLLEALSASDSSDLTPDALIEGIEFFSVDAANPDAEPVSQGKAAPYEVLLGVDFPCNSLLIFKLEVGDAGSDPFRVDYKLIPSSSTR